ncbi:hypothetical protein [Deefgea sp. CFH1-16]|uniref:hypothetical protein n=1 Tax=Deefgea sp. CFH1-16 TaxID=2675457 RepID=UPI0015F68B31|nr:hypothetical protein [Deefgea sp. CFH1-16]MBM5575846.1 hypothetical protein [Deefgea sp. CFH1-16]
MNQDITDSAVTAAASASGLVKAAPPVAVSGAFWAGVSVPELIQYLTLLWLLYQITDSLWTGYPKWRARFVSISNGFKKWRRNGKAKR